MIISIKKPLSFSFLWIVCFVFSQGQSINFYNLGTKDGLTSSFVIDIFQDRTGIMWLSTQGGAAYYDGTKVKVLQHYPGDSTTLPQNNIRSIIQDSKGILWMATFGSGLVKYNPVTEKLETFVNPFSNSSNRIHRLVSDKAGKIWIATEGSGLHCFDPIKETFSYFDPNPNDPEPQPRRQLRNLAIDASGVLWVASRFQGFYSFNPKNNKWTLYNNLLEGGIKVPSNRITYIFCTKAGQVLVTGEQSLCVINGATGMVQEMINLEKLVEGQISDFISMTVLEDSNHRWWIGTNKGLILYDRKSNLVKLFKNDPLADGSISDSRILSLYEDVQKNIWVGTWSAGASITPKNGTRFSKIVHHPLNKNSLSSNNILSLTNDKEGNLWVATLEEGLSKYEPKANKFLQFRGDTTSRWGLYSDRVWAIYTDKQGMVWAGCNSGGLHKINPKTNVIEKIVTDISEGRPLTKSIISAIYQDEKGYYWLGTFSERALLRYDKSTNKITQYPIFLKGDSSAAAATQIFSITSSPNGYLWISTNGAGLIRFNPNDGSYDFYQNDKRDPYSLSANKVGQIYCDKQGILWLLTLDAGLQCMNTRYPGAFATLSKEKGLLDNMPQALVEDNQGMFWLSSKGITRFIRPQVEMKLLGKRMVPVILPLKQLHHYTKEFGITNNSFNATAGSRSFDGNIYFGGEFGATFFHPKNIEVKNIEAQVYITNFSVFGKTLALDSSLMFKKHLQLKYDQNFISFEFSASDYTSKTAKTYQYQLVGLDNDWVNSNSSQVATYTGIKPGKYHFKVRVMSIDGIWSKPAEIYLSVTPPFWKTYWFISMCILLIILTVYVVVRQRINRIRKEEQKKSVHEREKLELELKALRAQMNPHFLFNALNSIERYIWQQDQEKATLYLAKFAKLIRLILENSREDFIPLSKEIAALEYYIQLEALRFNHSFEYEIKIEEDIDTEYVLIQPMIIQPIVENAIIHGLSNKLTGEPKLKIEIKWYQQGLILINIEDNGVGRKARENETRKSLGMSITQERIEKAVNQNNKKTRIEIIDLKDEQGNGIGTRVELIIEAIFED